MYSGHNGDAQWHCSGPPIGALVSNPFRDSKTSPGLERGSSILRDQSLMKLAHTRVQVVAPQKNWFIFYDGDLCLGGGPRSR